MPETRPRHHGGDECDANERLLADFGGLRSGVCRHFAYETPKCEDGRATPLRNRRKSAMQARWSHSSRVGVWAWSRHGLLRYRNWARISLGLVRPTVFVCGMTSFCFFDEVSHSPNAAKEPKLCALLRRRHLRFALSSAFGG